MTRNHCSIWAAALSLALAGMSLHARGIPCGKSEPPVPKRDAAKSKLIRKDYSVAELLPIADIDVDSVNRFMKAIVHAVRPKSWKDQGGPATIEYCAEKKILRIEQTAEAHREIRRLLKAISAMFDEDCDSSDSIKVKSSGPTVESILSLQPKQYGHVVMDDVRVNAAGIHCTIKRIRLMYKGDGFDKRAIEKITIAGEGVDALPKEVKAGLYEIGEHAVKAAIAEAKNENTPKQEKVERAELRRLAAEDEKEVKVVLWTYMALDPREEFIQADRRLAGMLAGEIRRLSEENKEKVTIVEPNLVEQYKSRHPNWQALEPATVAHDFNADYVISLEINKLSLYEPKANQQIYRGYTEILVSVVDPKHPDDLQSKEFNDRYPTEPRGDMGPLDMPLYQLGVTGTPQGCKVRGNQWLCQRVG